MRKALFLTFIALALGVGPFSVSAATIYQQLSDSSGEVELPNSATMQLLGSFTVASSSSQFVVSSGLCTSVRVFRNSMN